MGILPLNIRDSLESGNLELENSNMMADIIKCCVKIAFALFYDNELRRM